MSYIIQDGSYRQRRAISPAFDALSGRGSRYRGGSVRGGCIGRARRSNRRLCAWRDGQEKNSRHVASRAPRWQGDQGRIVRCGQRRVERARDARYLVRAGFHDQGLHGIRGHAAGAGGENHARRTGRGNPAANACSMVAHHHPQLPLTYLGHSRRHGR